jgi:hypothetical protein
MPLRYIVIAGFLSHCCLVAQTVHQVTPVAQPGSSYVVFKFDWDQGQPWIKYTISANEAGDAHFKGIGNPVESGGGDEVEQGFVLSDANRQKIFELTKKTGYFQTELESKVKNIAKTGQKTLEYHRGSGGGGPERSSATYNYSQDTDVIELTRLFQAIATTIDFGSKLAFDYRFNKLGLDARLHSLQEMKASHFAEEIQAIEPILQKIANDPNMMHINQVTARQLLRSIGSTLPASAPASQP